MVKRQTSVLFAIALALAALAGCGGASHHSLPRTRAQGAHHVRPLGSSPLPPPGVTLGVSDSGMNYTAYAVDLAAKPSDPSDLIVCYVTALQTHGTLSFSGGDPWTVVGAVESPERTQQIVAYRNATAADIAGQTYVVSTTSAGNQTGWVCDIVHGGYGFGQVVTGSHDALNGTMPLASAVPSAPGTIFLGFLAEDHAWSQSYGTPAGYGLLASHTAYIDTWNFWKIASTAEPALEQPAAASAYTGPQPWALSALVALAPPPAPAPIAQDGSDSQVNSSGPSATLSLPAAPGDVQLVLVASSSSHAGFSVPPNFALIDGSPDGSRTIATYCAASALTPNPEFSTSAGRIAAIGIAFANASCALDGHSIAATANSNVSSSAPVTPTADGDALVFMALNDATTGRVAAEPDGLSEAPASGGSTGAMFSERDYVALGPALAPQQPALTWRYAGTGNYALAASILLKASSAPAGAPGPLPAPLPTATTAPAPGPVACCADGVEWPASFRPYGPASPWNLALTNTTDPQLYPGSDAMIAHLSNGGGGAGPAVHTSEYGGGNDYGHPVYFTSGADPLVRAVCQIFCNPAGITALRVAPRSRPVGGTDHHMIEVQPDGTETGAWEVGQSPGSPLGVVTHDWTAGDRTAPADTFYYGGGGPCTNFYTGSGFTSSGIAMTALGSCGAGGTITASELTAGAIPHALFVSIACVAAGTYAFPGFQNGDHPCTGGGPDVPLGAHLWLDLPDDAIDGLAISNGGKTILHALHGYGAFVGDTKCFNACPSRADFNFGVMVEPDVQFTAFGVSPTPLQTFARGDGWSPLNVDGATRYILGDPWTPLDWKAHLHVVATCYARGTC
jgi:hypothetical protein